MLEEIRMLGEAAREREISKERAASHLAFGESFLGEERRKTVRLMGKVDMPYSKSLILVHHIVYGEGVWAARTGRVVMFARERGQVSEADFRIPSAQLMIKRRQEEIHPLQSRQQRPSSTRREPTLVDPLPARGTSIACEKQEQQQG